IKAVHAVLGAGDAAAVRESAGVARTVAVAAEEVAVQRQDHAGAPEPVLGTDRRAGGKARALPIRARVGRLIREPARLRQALGEDGPQAGARGRSAAAREKRESGTPLLRRLAA